MGKPGKADKADSIHWSVSHGETWRDSSAGRGEEGWAEKIIWHGVLGSWNKETWEPDEDPRNSVLLLTRFTGRDFSWYQTGFYKISLEQCFSKWPMCYEEYPHNWCWLLVKMGSHQKKCRKNLSYLK